MSLIAWSPQGAIPPKLVGVMIKAGAVTHKDWLEALSDRVSKMATEAGSEVTAQACQMLGVPTTSNPQEAGQFLLEGNWNLREHLTVAMETEFPTKAERGDLTLVGTLKETDLMTWAELALSMVSASSLD